MLQIKIDKDGVESSATVTDPDKERKILNIIFLDEEKSKLNIENPFSLEGYEHSQSNTFFSEGKKLRRIYKDQPYLYVCTQGKIQMEGTGKIYSSLYLADKELTGGKSKLWDRWEIYHEGKWIPLKDIKGKKV